MTAVGQPWKMPGTQSVGRTLQAEGGPLAARFGHCYSFTHESLPLPDLRDLVVAGYAKKIQQAARLDRTVTTPSLPANIDNGDVPF